MEVDSSPPEVWHNNILSIFQLFFSLAEETHLNFYVNKVGGPQNDWH